MQRDSRCRAGMITIEVTLSSSYPPPGEAVDCFDSETLARMFFVPLADQVHDAVREADLDQATSIIVQNHRLHAVPFIPKGGIPKAARTHLHVGSKSEFRIETG